MTSSIGALNHKFFCLFLLYTALSCAVSLILILMRMVHCGGYHVTEDNEIATSAHLNLVMENDNSNKDNEANSLRGDRYLSSTEQQKLNTYIYSECQNLYFNHWVTILAICSLVFLLFTSAMGWEQLEAIETGKGKIARMQSSSATTRGGELLFNTVTTEFNEMFGGDSPHPTWHWFLPMAVQFPRGMRQVVLGYEFQETPVCVRPNDRSENDTDDDNGDAQHGQTKDYDDEADALLLSRAEAGQGVSPDNNNINRNKADEVRQSPYTGRPVEPLPLISRRSSSRSRTASSSSSTNHESSSNHDNHDDEHGITLVDRNKARLV